jgi:capsular exopolysaccharide synthesis family protein
MERIREAVERARRERQGSGVALGRAAPPEGNHDSEAKEDLDQIVYTRTQVVEVPRALLRDRHIVSGLDPCAFTEAFKILSTRVSRILHERHWSTLAVTSATEGEGKTLVAINLAISLARQFQRTALLVDADMRKPSVGEYFGLKSPPGLSHYLNDDKPIEDLLINPGIPGFVFLPGGAPQPHSSEMLGWEKTRNLVEEMKTRYPSRIVIFDLPPIFAGADVLAFAPHVEAMLLVVEEGGPKLEDIRHAADLLASTHLIGTVLSKSREPVVSVYGRL